MGTANTDWQDLIYRTALSHDHNITVSGAVKDLPYRVSVGFTNQEGILKNSDFKRVTAALNLNPSFFDDHLTMNLNAKGMYARSAYADGGAVGAAVKWTLPKILIISHPNITKPNSAMHWIRHYKIMGDFSNGHQPHH